MTQENKVSEVQGWELKKGNNSPESIQKFNEAYQSFHKELPKRQDQIEKNAHDEVVDLAHFIVNDTEMTESDAKIGTNRIEEVRNILAQMEK